jgi:hypothetical protein
MAESGRGPGEAGQGGEAGTGKAGAEPIPLPTGSRELNGIVNLVDAGAAAELEQVLTAQTPVFLTLRDSLTKGVNLFLKHYLEDWRAYSSLSLARPRAEAPVNSRSPRPATPRPVARRE